MKRYIRPETTAYRHYYKDYTITQQPDGFYYIYDMWDRAVTEDPFDSIISAEYYIDTYL